MTNPTTKTQQLTEEQYNDRLQNLLEELENIVEHFTHRDENKYSGAKDLASEYLGESVDQLNKGEQRKLRAKTKKMKTSDKKSERDRITQLSKQITTAFNARSH